ncbi:cox cluster protein [Halostella sp. JP-L12]|uniref:DUF7541 family protein n=1 Tax=Halostella TaxID=1843185 RepID=UPI000EF787CF|nr:MULTISPECIES: cox cluster protein [Halostella]NHN49911.1 cox cluster protein [Halostella sp. JP-L12]
MDEQPGLSDQYRMSSPWPMLVAFGIAIAEVGIFWPLAPVAVGGLLLLVGSLVGIIRETGYVESPWPLLAGFGVALVLIGAALFSYSGGAFALNSVAESTRSAGSIGLRGVSIAIAGGLAVVGAVVGKYWTTANADPRY